MSVEVNGVRVYDAAYLRSKVPGYFIGCTANIGKLVERKNIPRDKFFYASYSKTNGYKVLDHDTGYRARRLLIREDWVHNNVPGFSTTAPHSNTNNTYNTKHIDQGDVPPPAPPLITLAECEKYQGGTTTITVRGKRGDIRDLYFRGSDVQKVLHIADLKALVMNVTAGFVEGVHYKLFRVSSIVSADLSHNNNQNSGEARKTQQLTSMYLTYWGLTKLLAFMPYGNNVLDLHKWVLDTLVASNDNTSNIADVTDTGAVAGMDVLKCFLDTNVNVLPVIYLFYIGTVKQLRGVLDIPPEYADDDVVMKYGLTKDLKRRAMEHDKVYGRMGVPGMFHLKYHVYVDPFYLQYAETEIERYFKSAKWHLGHSKHTELIVVPEHMISTVIHNEFKRLGATYAGKLSDLQTQLHNEQKINEQLRNQAMNQDAYHKEMMEHMERSYRDLDRMYHTTCRDKDTIINLYKAINNTVFEETHP